MNEKSTVSLALALARRANGMPQPTFKSSPMHSRYSSAPWAFQTFAASLAMRP